jgi:hypothetical protein
MNVRGQLLGPVRERLERAEEHVAVCVRPAHRSTASGGREGTEGPESI